MTTDVAAFMAEALRSENLHAMFAPAEVGARIGMTRDQAEFAARALAKAGVLELGFDCAAEFTRDYRKAHLATRRAEDAAVAAAPEARLSARAKRADGASAKPRTNAQKPPRKARATSKPRLPKPVRPTLS